VIGDAERIDISAIRKRLAEDASPEPIVRAWRRYIATRLPDPIVRDGVRVALTLVAYDVARGRSGFAHLPLPLELVGLNPMLVTCLKLDAEDIFDEVLHDTPRLA
jgi:hypothetical protein